MRGKKRPPFTESHRKNMAISKIGNNNPQWKGDDVGIVAIHKWVERHKPKPELCEMCNIIPPIDLANISGKYLRDINDFQWLCRKCHMESDGRMNNLKRYMKGVNKIDMSGRICSVCGSDKTYIEKHNNRPSWHYIEGKLLCNICYDHEKRPWRYARVS